MYTPLLRRGRPGPLNTIFATMVTFLLIGLWHGASWNFIVLGAYNGLWMCFYIFVVPAIPRRFKGHFVLDFFAWAFHTLVVLQVTGLLFREVSLARVWQHLSSPWFSWTREELAAATWMFTLAVIGTIPLNLSYWLEDKVLPKISASPWFLPLQTTWWSVEALAIFVFYRDVSEDFIYFQF